MLKRILLLKFSSVILAVSLLAGIPAISHAQQPAGGQEMTQAAANEWRPGQPAEGMGSTVWTNYNGNGGQLFIDLQKGNLEVVREHNRNTEQFIIASQNSYTVPTAANDMPGRLQIDVVPGTYNYTASVPDVGTVNGTFEVKAGQVIGLNFYGGEPKTVGHHHGHSDDDSAQHAAERIIFTKLLVAQEDMTTQAR